MEAYSHPMNLQDLLTLFKNPTRCKAAKSPTPLPQRIYQPLQRAPISNTSSAAYPKLFWHSKKYFLEKPLLNPQVVPKSIIWETQLKLRIRKWYTKSINPIFSSHAKDELQSHTRYKTHYHTVRILPSEALPMECPFSARPTSGKTCMLLFKVIIIRKVNRKISQNIFYTYIYITYWNLGTPGTYST